MPAHEDAAQVTSHATDQARKCKVLGEPLFVWVEDVAYFFHSEAKAREIERREKLASRMF